MASSLPALDAQTENYQQAVKDFLSVFGSTALIELPEAQLALSTLDGLTEVLEWNNQGQTADEIACIWLASLRWYTRTGNLLSASHPFSLERAFDSAMITHADSAADPATLSGLAHADMQLIERNLQSQENGSGALLRVLPIALLPVDEDQTVAIIAAKVAALTHGAVDAISAAAATAVLARAALAYRGTSDTPLTDALDYASAWAEKLAENTGVPGEGKNIVSALSCLSLSRETDQKETEHSALAVLANLAHALHNFEAEGTKLSLPETAADKLLYGLWGSLCELAGYGSKLQIKIDERATETLGLLTHQWFKELGIS